MTITGIGTGTNSLQNPANRWYTWAPKPSSIQECNAPDGEGGSHV